MQAAFDSTDFTESLPRKCDCFLPARIFVVSLRLPQRHDKLSFPLLCFLFFFFFVEESVGEVLEVCLARSWSGVRTDPPRLLVCDRCVSDHMHVCNRGLFQRLSGFETGHPAAAGPLPAFDFSVSDEQDCFFRPRDGLF